MAYFGQDPTMACIPQGRLQRGLAEALPPNRHMITLNYGESRYFTGLFRAFPRAMLSGCLQAVDVASGYPGTCARFGKWHVALSEFPMPDTRIPKKIFTATEKYTVDEFQGIITCTRETSHRCDFGYCLNPLHLVAESHTINMQRNKCFTRARDGAENGLRVNQYCSNHTPPCLLRLACESGTGKAITEYESLGNPVVENLPAQVKSAKGPALLVSDIRIFRWEDGARVLDREIACPSVEPNLLQGKPDSLECSAGIFGTRVRDFMHTFDD
ncbi:hypothetical protein CDV31_012285 [Fusarium ambrosium]|uniref:Zinc-binding loop region of homing endonuclease domain-containing protein n=1 Tax=Fusarium ambrosium TaxID=131363 RepID=A0A428TAT5_9HYPO|nr:hypothetical protein CDV31_012285 [Fusarium ambrosium]